MQLKRFLTAAVSTLREGAGEQVKASGLTAEREEAACGREVVIHQMTGGSVDYLNDPTGNRRFWVIRGEANSSGLTAESLEASATNTTSSVAAGNATEGEPGAAA